jgi:hypothetical protein
MTTVVEAGSSDLLNADVTALGNPGAVVSLYVLPICNKRISDNKNRNTEILTCFLIVMLPSHLGVSLFDLTWV